MSLEEYQRSYVYDEVMEYGEMMVSKICNEE